jgi:hypothetical protein
MKLSIHCLCWILVMTFTSCQKESSYPLVNMEQIAFVYEDGKPIEAGACIKPTTNYAIAITVKLTGNPDGKAVSVKYSLNGVADEISFVSGGTKIKKVTLINGLNVAQTIETKQEARIILDIQEFELVN